MSKEVRISILQRGWVFVGYYSREDGRCKLSKAKCIRRWGTSKGIGQLVNGPLSETVLDSAGTVEYNELTEVASICANAEKWADVLG